MCVENFWTPCLKSNCDCCCLTSILEQKIPGVNYPVKKTVFEWICSCIFLLKRWIIFLELIIPASEWKVFDRCQFFLPLKSVEHVSSQAKWAQRRYEWICVVVVVVVFAAENEEKQKVTNVVELSVMHHVGIEGWVFLGIKDRKLKMNHCRLTWNFVGHACNFIEDLRTRWNKFFFTLIRGKHVFCGFVKLLW